MTARVKRNFVTAAAIVGFAGSLLLLYQARASLRERDEQVKRLRERMTRLEADVARLSSTHPLPLTPDEREAYLSLPYKEFDATPGSGHRRFRDQPRHPSQAGELIEAYLERHPQLPIDQWMNLQGHAAQLFAMGGMNERAITHLDRLLAHNPGNEWAQAMKAFLLLDGEGLLAIRRRAGGEAAQMIEPLLERLGQSYADLLWTAVCSEVRIPAAASARHRAAAERLRQAFALPDTTATDAPSGGGIPAQCIWLEIRSLGGTPDTEGYVILHAGNSTVISATSEQQLDAAVERFIEASRQRDGQREVPFGLMTSFELAR